MERILMAVAWPGTASGPISPLTAAISLAVALVLTAAVALLARRVARERRGRIAPFSRSR